MPSLGFLKKKRTRDGNSDASASNPTSPVTPTSSKHFSSSSQSQSRVSHSHTRSSANSQAGAFAQSAPASGPAIPQQTQPLAEKQQQQPPMNPPNAQPASSFATSPNQAQQYHDQQNLPSINNLIHAPHHDGSTNSYPQSNSLHPASQTVPHTVSPGTDPALLQQQQQQALPHPNMQNSQSANQQQSQQHHYQQQNQPQQHAGHHQQQASVSQPRVTKGKYTLTDFEILRTLGTGSFGRVHLVQSKHNQRFYAVKVLKKAQVVKMKQVEHTNDERRMLSDVKHPFLITLWGTFQDIRNLYMVMDFVEGGELFSLLRKSGVSLNSPCYLPQTRTFNEDMSTIPLS